MSRSVGERTETMHNDDTKRFASLAKPAGFQEGFGDIPGFSVWLLLRDIPGHPKHSTVSAATLNAFLSSGSAQKVAEFAELRERLT